MSHRVLKLLAVAALAVCLSGLAGCVSQTCYHYAVDSDPEGADVYMGHDNLHLKKIGTTPIGFDSPRDLGWAEQMFYCRKEGYESSYIMMVWENSKPVSDGDVTSLVLNCSLPKDQATLQREQQEKERQQQAAQRFQEHIKLGKILEALKVDLNASVKPEDAAARVTTAQAVLYGLPCTLAPQQGRLPQFAAVRVVGSLPSGWVQVQGDDNTPGWIHSLALDRSFVDKLPGRDFESELSVLLRKEQQLHREDQIEAQRRLELAQKAAEEKQREAAARQAKLAQQRRAKAAAAARQKQQQQKDGDIFGQALALGLGAAVIGSSDLPADTQAQIGNAFAADVLNDTGGTNMQAVQSQVANSSHASRTGAGGSGGGGDLTAPESYSFTCPAGDSYTITIPPTESYQCNAVYKRYARVYSCNLVDDMQEVEAAMKNCR